MIARRGAILQKKKVECDERACSVMSGRVCVLSGRVQWHLGRGRVCAVAACAWVTKRKLAKKISPFCIPLTQGKRAPAVRAL